MILYFGNKLSKESFTADYINKLSEFDTIVAASHYQIRVIRLMHMVYVFLTNKRKTNLIIIEVFSGWAFYYAIIVTCLSRLFSIPYIPVLHGGNLLNRLNSSPFLSHIIFNHSSKNVTPSMYLQEQFLKKGYSIKYIPNFIELDKFPYNKRNKCSPKLLWVRAFHKIYNPEMAVKVLAGLVKKYPSAELCMVGPDKDGSMKSSHKLAENLGVLNNITFTGYLTKSDWVKLSIKYDIFINTTNFESFGLSVLEASACGLPIVTTNSGELSYLYECKSDALLVNKNDVGDMVKKISQLLDDHLLCENLSVNARKKAELFTWNSVKKKWMNLMAEIN